MKFIVDEIFQIKGRGCVLALKSCAFDKNDKLSVSDVVIIEKPNGEKMTTTIIGVEHIKKLPGAPDIHPGVLVGPECSKGDIPLNSLIYKKNS